METRLFPKLGGLGQNEEYKICNVFWSIYKKKK